MKGLFLIIALFAGAMAQQATSTLKGQVVDELGGAIVGALVVVVDPHGRENWREGILWIARGLSGPVRELPWENRQETRTGCPASR